MEKSNFVNYQEKLNLIGDLSLWYSNISAIVHGQIPGVWIEHKSLDSISHNPATLKTVVNTFVKGERIVHHLFLCTTGRDLWDFFSTTAKGKLIKGLSGEMKTILGLDSA